jgi:TatD DNase family protein
VIPFLDSHAHLAGEAFDADRDSVLQRAREAGAAGVVCIGESLEAAAGARRLAERHPDFCFWTAGIHPHDAANFDARAHPMFLRELIDHGAVAVGECGLDYHYDHAPHWKQRQLFSSQIALAADLRRPLVVHTRDAAEDTAAMLEAASEAGVTGVLHCFTGPHALAERALAAGWYLSFSGIITFRKWDDDALLRMVPDDRLLVESDAPYLSPVPYRGKRNEPAWVRHTVDRLARARGIEAETLGAVTVANAHRFFGVAMDEVGAV